MIGCVAKAQSYEVLLNTAEMEDAQWYDRAELEAAVKAYDGALPLQEVQRRSWAQVRGRRLGGGGAWSWAGPLGAARVRQGPGAAARGSQVQPRTGHLATWPPGTGHLGCALCGPPSGGGTPGAHPAAGGRQQIVRLSRQPGARAKPRAPAPPLALLFPAPHCHARLPSPRPPPLAPPPSPAGLLRPAALCDRAPHHARVGAARAPLV